MTTRTMPDGDTFTLADPETLVSFSVPATNAGIVATLTVDAHDGNGPQEWASIAGATTRLGGINVQLPAGDWTVSLTSSGGLSATLITDP